MSTYDKAELKKREILELLESAEHGDCYAQNSIGAKLAVGYFVDQDSLGAAFWYCRACEQGLVDAKWNLGSMLIDGEYELPANKKIAIDYIYFDDHLS